MVTTDEVLQIITIMSWWETPDTRVFRGGQRMRACPHGSLYLTDIVTLCLLNNQTQGLLNIS